MVDLRETFEWDANEGKERKEEGEGKVKTEILKMKRMVFRVFKRECGKKTDIENNTEAKISSIQIKCL